MPNALIRDDFVRGERIKLKSKTYYYYDVADCYVNFGGKFAAFHRWLPDGNCVVVCKQARFVISPTRIVGYNNSQSPTQQHLF